MGSNQTAELRILPVFLHILENIAVAFLLFKSKTSKATLMGSRETNMYYKLWVSMEAILSSSANTCSDESSIEFVVLFK